MEYDESLAAELESLAETNSRTEDAKVLLDFANKIRRFPNGSFTERQEKYIDVLRKRALIPYQVKYLDEDEKEFIKAFMRYWYSTSPFYRARFPGRCHLIDKINESVSCNQSIEIKDWEFLISINKTFLKNWNLLKDRLSCGELVRIKEKDGIKNGLSLGERKYDTCISYKILINEEIKWIPVGMIKFNSRS